MMSIADEVRKLHELRLAGALSDEEFAQAKAAALRATTGADAPGDGGQMAEHLASVAAANDLARLDREWEIEREKYLVTDRFGRALVPRVGGSRMFAFVGRTSMVGGVFVAIVGTIWTAIAIFLARELPAPFSYALPGFGVLFIGFGLISTWRVSSMARTISQEYERNARRYQVAFAEYEQRRQVALTLPQGQTGHTIAPPNAVPEIGSAWLES